MLDFFINKPSDIQYAYQLYPRWDWIKRNYTDSINNLISYYNFRNTVVNNKNLLVRIIKNAFPGLDTDIFGYVKDLEINADYTARHFKLTNNKSVGDFHRNVFYSGKSIEIINHVVYDYNFLDIDKDYTKYSPLRVVYTEETDLDLHLLDGTKVKTKPSLTVVELDITLMLLMYRAWCRRRIKFGLSINACTFVSTIVIPNTIRTMVDHIIFNRFICKAKGISIPEFKLKHKLYVVDYSRGIDSVLDKVVDDIVNTNIPLYKFINTIPTLYYDDMFSALRLGRRLYTRQSKWTLWMSRVHYINILLDLLGPNGISRNLPLIKTLPYDIKELKNGSTCYYDKLKEVKEIQEEYIEVIDSIYNKI